MNPIENLWGMLTRSLYADRRQFENVSDLKEAILYAWNELEDDTLKKLAKDKPNRLIELLEKHGAEISYAQSYTINFVNVFVLYFTRNSITFVIYAHCSSEFLPQ